MFGSAAAPAPGTQAAGAQVLLTYKKSQVDAQKTKLSNVLRQVAKLGELRIVKV
jgi:hypothetical protein